MINKNDEEFKTMQTIEFKENSYYWLFSNNLFKLIKITAITTKDFEYVDCSVIFLQDSSHFSIIESDTTEKKLPLKEKYNLKSFQVNQLNPQVNDLSALPNVTYPSIMLNLKLRSENGKYFTRAGKVLVGINLKYTYNHNLNLNLDQNNGTISSECSALLESLDLNESQTIIINGLPSTGKSIFTKTLCENILIKIFSASKSSELNAHFQNCLSLLDIFGNSIECQNWNSSRYMRTVKFYTMKINSVNTLVKVKFKHFLFEKGRASVFLGGNDMKCNFHIFHALIEGLYNILIFNNTSNIDESFVKLIKMEYSFLLENNLLDSIYRTYHCTIFQHIGIEEDLHILYQQKLNQFLSLSTEFKIENKKVLKKIINLLISILLLLQIEIQIDIEGKAFIEEECELIIFISKLINCDSKVLRDKLISREIRSPRGSFYVIKFTPDEALRVRNNLVKFLYENLFSCITRIVNVSLNDMLKYNDNDGNNFVLMESKYLEVIECLGFQTSGNAVDNTLENLFINYSNDKLNNLLFDTMIKGEVELYQQEEITNEANFDFEFLKKKPHATSGGITSKPRGSIIKMNYNKNNGLLDFDIENTMQACDDNSRGIFKLLDVQSSLVNTNHGSIKALCDNIKLNWPQLTTTSDSFFLVHFGNVVEYGASDFILKNIDSVYDELKEISTKYFKSFSKSFLSHKFEENIKSIDKNILNKCNEYLLKDIINKDEIVKSTPTSKTSSARNSVSRRFSQNMKLKSNSEKFLTSIRKLLRKISLTKLSFVKLIKSRLEKDTDNNNNNNNDYKILFDEKFVLQQLYSSGILESIILAKGGFFIRYNYQDIIKKLSIFTNFIQFDNKDIFIASLAKILSIPSSEFIIGKSLLFIKNHAMTINHDLINCSNLPSFIINAISKNLFTRFVKVARIFRYFLSIGSKKRFVIFSNEIENATKKQKLKTSFWKITDYANIRFSGAVTITHACKNFMKKNFEKAKQEKIKEIQSKKIQNAYKNYKMTKSDKKIILAIQNAECKYIQNAFRKFQQKKIEKKKEEEMEIGNLIKKIQKAFRVHQHNKIEKQKTEILRTNQCIKIQRSFKEYKNRQNEVNNIIQDFTRNNQCKNIQRTYKLHQFEGLSKKVSEIRKAQACRFIQKTYQAHKSHHNENINKKLRILSSISDRIVKQKFFSKLQQNLQIKNSAAQIIQTAFKSHLKNTQITKEAVRRADSVKNFIEITNSYKLKTFFKQFLDSYKKVILIQKHVKSFLKCKHENNQKLFLLFTKINRSHFLSQLKHSFHLISTISKNKNSNSTDIVTSQSNRHNGGNKKDVPKKNLLVDVEESISAGNQAFLMKKTNSNSLTGKGILQSQHTSTSSSIPPKKKTNTTLSKSSVTSGPRTSSVSQPKLLLVKTDNRETIAQIKNTKQNLIDGLGKLKKMNENLENCQLELDKMIKEMNQDIEKINDKNSNVQVNYIQLNKEKKRNSAAQDLNLGRKINDMSTHIHYQHPHDQSRNSGGDKTSGFLKKLCYSDMLK